MVGLGLPVSFTETLNKYIIDHDHIARFISEKCETKKSYSVKTRDLLDSFNEWAFENEIHPLNSRTLKKEMESKKFIYKKEGVMKCVGIKLKEVGTKDEMANI